MEEKARFNVKYMEEMKLYTHEEMLDRVIGTKGTPAREKYETDINNFRSEEHTSELHHANESRMPSSA